MLTAAELTAMRTTVNASLPGTAVIQRGTLTSDSGGGYTEGWTNAGTAACRIASIRGAEGVEGSRISPDSEWVLTLPADTSVLQEDRLLTGGGTFNVTALRAPHSYEVSRRLEAKKVD